jgi:hypothetical protein
MPRRTRSIEPAFIEPRGNSPAARMRSASMGAVPRTREWMRCAPAPSNREGATRRPRSVRPLVSFVTIRPLSRRVLDGDNVERAEADRVPIDPPARATR